MRELQLLADACRISRPDLVALAREAAGDASGRIRGPEDLTGSQFEILLAVVRMLAAPVDLARYELEPLLAAA